MWHVKDMRDYNSYILSFKKKAQLSLTNPRDAKPCRKLLQFDVETSYRQLNKQLV